MAKLNTIDFSDVRDFYARNQPDGHWFDAGTLRFWKCKLPKVAYETNAGLLFITSEENFDRTKRLYTIRRQNVSGSISTVGTFQGFKSRQEALKEIKHPHEESEVAA